MTYNMTITDKSLAHNWMEFDSSKASENNTNCRKIGSSYIVVNNTLISIDAKNNGANIVIISSANAGFLRNETIIAIGSQRPI